MNEALGPGAQAHSPQRCIQSRHVCPTNAFVEFKREEIEHSIPERFELQVRRDPNRLAVKADSDTLSYGELNRAANRTARTVLAQLPGEGTVALLLEHGAPMIAAIIGVLKAGKTYVPLDPSYPHARNAHILQDSQAALIVTNNKNLSLAKAFAQTHNAPQLINLDESNANLSDQNLGLSLAPDTLAYIVYTSGSTGQPKGVVQNHRNVLHQLMTYTNSLHICADDRLTLLHSCSFSAARLDVFGALLNGATLYPLRINARGMTHLAHRLIREGITILHWVPTPFRHFVGALAGAEEFPQLRLLVLGSEPVYQNDVELYKRHFSQGCLFVNRLGTTETGNIRLYFIDQGTRVSGNVVPSGYALEDTQVLLLDDAGEEVGVNRIGEIAVKSRYLSPGYWRQPDLTREAFQPDPQGGSARIYRTGDLGCMLPDGCLMHLGRKDFQVKVRGYRIELAEIEQALLDSAAVKEAVVVAHEDAAGEKRLVAYIVPGREFTLTIGELRWLVQVKLPDYMVPSAFMLLDALPLTPTGKVDRLALPKPDRARGGLGGAFVAPRTAVEEVVTAMWAEVLGLEQIGVQDSFFDLGGHSLLAAQIISRISRAFQVELPLRRFFEAPTVADLAQAIIANEAEPGQTEKIARVLSRLQGMSAEDVRHMLRRKRQEQGGGHR